MTIRTGVRNPDKNRTPPGHGVLFTKENAKAMSLAGQAAIKAKIAAGIIDPQRMKRLTAIEWEENYTGKAFPRPWNRFFNVTHNDYKRYYGRQAGADAPQYRTMCWRAAALSTALAMIEAKQIADEYGQRHKYQQQLVDVIAQLQRYTESEKHENVVIDATKERVLSLVIAVADHVLADEAKPALFAALRRVIAGGEFDPGRAISLLSQAAQKESGTVIDSTSRPYAGGSAGDEDEADA